MVWSVFAGGTTLQLDGSDVVAEGLWATFSTHPLLTRVCMLFRFSWGSKPNGLQQRVSSLSNSTFDMLQSLLEQKHTDHDLPSLRTFLVIMPLWTSDQRAQSSAGASAAGVIPLLRAPRCLTQRGLFKQQRLHYRRLEKSPIWCSASPPHWIPDIRTLCSGTWKLCDLCHHGIVDRIPELADKNKTIVKHVISQN